MQIRDLFAAGIAFRSLPVPIRWGCALGMVVLSFLARYALFGPEPGFPYLLFFPAVILAGVLLNRGSGFVAALASTAVAVYFFVPPVRSLHIADSYDALGAVLYLGIALAIATVVEALHGAYAAADAARARAEAGERERAVLLAELGHRVRNDMQRLVGLLAMQASGAAPEVAAALGVAGERIRVVARLHDRLLRSDGEVVVDSREFLTSLGDDIRASLDGLRPIGLSVEAEPHPLPVECAGAVGLVANEIVTNALKYAFPDDREGAIRISFRRDGTDYVLSVADDGVGLPQGDDAANDAQGRRPGGLGRRLVRALAAQLEGHAEVRPARPSGTVATLRFPVHGRCATAGA